MTYQTNALYLIVRKGPGVGTALPVGGSVITIGRQAGNTVVISDHRVSRRHAQLTWRGSGYMLEDLGSGNGTWVNNARITTPVLLRPGDVIGLSQDVLLLFSDQPEADDMTYHVPAASSAPGTAIAARPPAPLAAPPPAARGTGWLAFGMGGLIALVLALLLVIAGLVVYFTGRSPASVTTPPAPTAVAVGITSVPPPPATAVPHQTSPAAAEVAASQTPYPMYTPYPTPTEAPVATYTSMPTPTPYPTYTPYPTPTDTPVPTYTPMPTPTPYPTYTPYPTPMPTFTSYPTYTPYPTPAPTATPYPTYTPYPTPLPTATPYPTYTPYPTFTSRPPPPPPPPPAEPTLAPPTATPRPVFTVKLGRNVVYEPWGRPTDVGGCKGPYNDRSPVRRLTIQLLVTNSSNEHTQDKWFPEFYTAAGAHPPSCIWYYNNTVVSPGETVDVTFATHVEVGDFVQTLRLDLLGHSATITLDASGNEIGRSYK